MTAGYSSLFNMLVQHFKLSESTAYQRLAALKLIEAVPEAQTALLNNNVNLSTLAEVQSFINKTEKSNDVKMPTKEKESLVSQIMDKSLKETKALLGDKNPELALPPDREKVLTSELTLLQIKVDAETMALLSEVKSLLGHQIHASTEVVIFRPKLDELSLKEQKVVVKTFTLTRVSVVTTNISSNTTMRNHIAKVALMTSTIFI